MILELTLNQLIYSEKIFFVFDWMYKNFCNFEASFFITIYAKEKFNQNN